MKFLRLLIYAESTIPIFRKGECCFCSWVISEDDVIMKATARLRGVQLHHLLYTIIYCPLKAILQSLKRFICNTLKPINDRSNFH